MLRFLVIAGARVKLRQAEEERRKNEEKWDKFWKDVNRDFKTY